VILYIKSNFIILRIRVRVHKTTFNNISVISWLSVLFVPLVEETRVPEKTTASHWQTLSHNIEYLSPLHEWYSNYDWLKYDYYSLDFESYRTLLATGLHNITLNAKCIVESSVSPRLLLCFLLNEWESLWSWSYGSLLYN
jgi:hypothetical protein